MRSLTGTSARGRQVRCNGSLHSAQTFQPKRSVYSLDELLRRTGQQEVREASTLAAMGLLLSDWSNRQAWGGRSLAWHVDRIERACALGQIELSFDRFGRFAGHLLWTRQPPSAEADRVREGPGSVSAADFATEGDVWILDARALYGSLNEQLLRWRDGVFAQEEFVSYFHERAGFLQAKRIVRDPSLSLFRRCAARPTAPALLDLKKGQNYLHAARAELGAAIAIGRVLRLLRRLGHFSAAPLQRVMARIRQPMAQHQWHMEFGADGEACAFLSWAWMTREDVRAMRPWHLLHAPSWSDGRLWVLADAVVTREGIDPVCRALGGGLFRDQTLHLCEAAGRWDGEGVPNHPALRMIGVTERARWAQALARRAHAAAAVAGPCAGIDLASIAANMELEEEPCD